MMGMTEEEYVICPECKSLVPHTPVCIYCGAKLPRPKRKEKEDLSLTLETQIEEASEESVQGRLGRYLLWRVRLLELLRSGKVSREVFEQLYREYSSVTKKAIERRRRLEEELEGIVKVMEERRRRLEELDVLRSNGLLVKEELLDEYSKLKSEIEELERQAARVRFQHRALGWVSSEGLSADMASKFSERFQKALLYLPTMVSQGLLSPGMEEEVREDLLETLKVLERERAVEESQPKLEEPTEVSREEPFDEEALFAEVSSVVFGHDDEIRRVIKAIKMGDNVLILGRHGEGKTELLLQLHRRLGGVYFHCNEEVSEREIIAGFNPSAFVGENPIHNGCLMQIASGAAKGLPIAFIDDIMKLRPKTQVILFEAMNNKEFTNPVDGRKYTLPEGFSVVSASNLESVAQEMPDAAFLDRFGKIVMWGETPDDAMRKALEPYRLPEWVVEFLLWVRREVGGMRYLVPVSFRNIIKFAREYNAYRQLYQDTGELWKLAVDRLLKMRVINAFGLKEYEEAREKMKRYLEGKRGRVT